MDFDLIQYYCREKYYHKMQTIAKSALQTQPNNSIIKLQYCVSLLLQNKIGEALQELESLLAICTAETKLAVLAATVHAHNLCQVFLNDLILRSKLQNEYT